MTFNKFTDRLIPSLLNAEIAISGQHAETATQLCRYAEVNDDHPLLYSACLCYCLRVVLHLNASIRTFTRLRKSFLAAMSISAFTYTRKAMKRGQMDTEKKVRISAALDADQHRRLKADCAMKGVDINEIIVDLVAGYLAGDITPPPASDEGDGDPLCSMVRACVNAGDPWRTAIAGVVVAIYEKMRRES